MTINLHLCSLPYIIITFLLMLTLPQRHCQEDHKYSICSLTYNCGSKDTMYPFWGGNRARYCGRDDAFEPNCVNNNIPSIQVGSQNFTILDINPTTYIMRILRTDIINYDDCSLDFTNTSLNSTLFQCPSIVHKITIFYNFAPRFSIGLNNFTCRGDTKKHVFYVDENLLQQFPGLVLNCGASVQVPILWDTFLNPNGGVAALDSALSYGFEVQYSADYDDCKECSRSGGICGRDDKTHFSCFAGQEFMM